MIPFYTCALFIKYFKIISSCLLKSLCEKRFVKSVKIFPANIKLINPIQNYPHIIESYVCILKIFIVTDKEPLTNFLISLGYVLQQNYQNK